MKQFYSLICSVVVALEFIPAKPLCFTKPLLGSVMGMPFSSIAKNSKVVLNNINSHANFHLKKAIGLFKSTPYNIFYQLAAELPPIYWIEFATAKELAKTFAFRLPASRLPDSYLSTNTSYSRIYSKYKVIFNTIAIINSVFNFTQKLNSTLFNEKVYSFQNMNFETLYNS